MKLIVNELFIINYVFVHIIYMINLIMYEMTLS
jgi:hypothetical protein